MKDDDMPELIDDVDDVDDDELINDVVEVSINSLDTIQLFMNNNFAYKMFQDIISGFNLKLNSRSLHR